MTPACPKDFVLDPNNTLCYKVIDGLVDFETAVEICSEMNADILYFDGEESQVEGFMDLLKLGKNTAKI